MRKIYVLLHDARNLLSQALAAFINQLSGSRQRNTTLLYTPALYTELKPEISKSNTSQMQNLTFLKNSNLKSFKGWMLIVVMALTAITISSPLSAQNLGNYAFTFSQTGSLDAMTGATSLAGSGTVTTGYNDDNASGVITMPGGFNFIFMGQLYTQFSVNSNGQMRLGSTAVAANASFAASTALMAPFAGDNSTGLAGDTDPISYVVTGTAPNRILKIQWKNFNLPFSSTAPAGANMQVWLYEGSGRIDYVYGAMSANAATSRSIFLSSSNTATTAGYLTIGSTPTFTLAATAVANTIAVGNVTNLFSSTNSTRWVYTFTPTGTAPADPTTLTFTAVSGIATTANWVDNSNTELGFAVVRATDAAFTQNVVLSSVASTTSAGTGTAYTSVQSGLTPGITYFYKIQALNEGLASAGLTGSQATNAAATYYYIGGASSDIATGASWNTAADGTGTTRGTAQTTDILIVDGQGTTPGSGTPVTLTMAAATSIGALQITSNTAVTLQSTTTTTRALTLTGSVGDELSVPSGSSLILNHATQAASISFSTGTGMTGTIGGTLSFAGSTSNVLTTTGGTGTVVTVQSTGIINLGAAANSLVGSAATLIISSGATVNSSGATTGAPPVPLATWGATSNLVVTGITTSTTAPTNNAQSFGNVTYNCPSATATMSWFTSSTTAVIKGNMTVQATGTGKLRLLTSGTLSILGDLIVSGGNCEVSSTSGVLTVAGNVTQSGGRLELTSGTSTATLKVAGTFNQSAGNLLVSGTTGTNNNSLEFNGTSSQNVTLSGTVSGPVNVRINNAAGISLTGTLPINVGAALTVSSGAITGSGSVLYSATNTYTSAAGATSSGTTITVGSTAGLVSGMVVTVTAGTGTFAANTTVSSVTNGTTFVVSAAPTVALSGGASVISGTITGNNRLIYNSTTAAQTASALEFPAANGPNSLTINNTATSPNNTVTVGFARSLGATAGVLTLTAGILDNGSNLLTINNTATGGISGGSATAYVKGPIARTLPASLVSGSTYTFPVGKAGYNPFELVNPTTGAGTVVAQAEVFDASTGGTPGTLLSSISTTRYWAAAITAGAGNFTNSFVRLNDTRGTRDAVGASTTLGGAYDQQGGVIATLAANSITTTTPALTTLPGFFVMGNLAAAAVSNLTITPSGAQCTNVSRAVTALVTPGGAAVTGVVINYSINGVAQTALSMTNTTGNGGLAADTWTGTIPTVTPGNATVTWSVTATDGNALTASATGTAYADEPLLAAAATATAVPGTICAGVTSSLSATLTAISAGTAQVGTGITLSGATDQNTAFNNRWSSYRMQLLYTAAELQAAGLRAGNITSIAFNIASLGDAATNANFRVKVGNTALSALTAFVDTTTGFTTVYNPKTYTHTASGLQTIPFDAPFNWDGTSSIIVQVVGSGANASNNSQTYYTATTANRAAYTSTSETNSASLSLNRLDIVFAGQALVNIPITSLVWDNSAGTGNPQTVTPSGTTAYTATITALGCTKATNAVTVTVNPIPTAPTAGTASTQCGSGVPTVSVSDPNTFTTPTFKWYADNVTTTALQTSTSVTYTTAITTTTSFWVSVINPTTGCESPRTQVTANVTTPDAVSASSNGPICLNSNLDLTATVTSGTNANIYTYTWAATPAAGSGIPTTVAGGTGTFGSPATTSVTPTAAGTYNYTVTAVDGTLGCTTSASVSVTVNPNPIVTAVTATPTPICSGGTVSLTAASSSLPGGAASIGAGATNSTSSGESMFSGGWGGVKTQYLVKASELSAAGLTAGNTITSLAFETAGAAGQQYTGFAVNIGHTTQTTMSLPLISAGLTQVYAGTEGANNGFTPAGTAVNTLNFGTGGTTSSFTWNGTDNIVISFCFSTVTGATTSSTTSVKVDAAGFTSSAYGKSDATLPAAFCPKLTAADFGTSGTASNRPKFTFGVSTTAANTWSWTTTLSGGSIANGATATHVPTTASVTTGTYTATATSAAGCTGSLTSASITVNPQPAAPFDFPSLQCGTATPGVQVTGASPGQYRWYTVPTGGTPLAGHVNDTLANYPISVPTHFYVAIFNGTCESSRTDVFADVISPDAVTANASSISLCLNDPAGVDLTITQGATNQTYGFTWSSPLAASGISGTAPGAPVTGLLHVSPTAAGTYRYTVSAVDGGCATSSFIDVTVKELPVINTPTATPSTLCEGQSTILLATTTTTSPVTGTVGAGASTSTGSGGSGVNYASPYSHWFGGLKIQYMVKASELIAAGLTAGTISSVAFDVTSAGTAYTGFMIKVGTTAATDLTTTFATGLTQVYYAGAAGTQTPTVGINTYTFGTGAGAGSSSSVAWNGTDNLIVEISWSNNNGGGTAAEVKYDSPAPSFNCFTKSARDNQTVATMQAETTGTIGTVRPKMIFGGTGSVSGAGSLTWSWDNGGGAGNQVTVTPAAGTTQYTVTGTNTTTNCFITAQVSVTVNPLPNAPTGSDAEQCGTAIPGISVTSTSGVPAPSFNWYSASTGGTLLQSGTTGVTGTTGTYTAVVGTTTTFYVTEVSEFGCESSPRTAVTVTVSAPDLITASTNFASICPGQSIDLTASYTPDFNSFATFDLTVDNTTGSGISGTVSLTPNATGSDPYTVTPTAAGTYIYTITAFDPDKGCTSSDTIKVVVNAIPTIPNTLAATPAVVCAGQNVVLTAVNSGSQTAPTGYCSATFSNTTREDNIGQVTFAGINNPAVRPTPQASNPTATALYTDYTGVAAGQVLTGQTYPFTLYQIHGTTDQTANFANVYIDFNRNGVFTDAGEIFTLSKPGATFYEDFVGDIAIPVTATLGVTRMRVVIREGAITTPCGTVGTWGEAEDYLVNIQGGIDPTYSIQWNPGSVTGSPATVNPLVTTDYAVTISALGCSATSSNITVTVNPIPLAPTAAPSTQCGVGVPTASVSGGAGTYKWYDAATGGNVIQRGGTTFTGSIAATTHFYVSDSSTAGCEGPRVDLLATVTTPPTLAITAGSTTTFCQGGSVTLDAASGSDPSYVNFTSWTAAPVSGAGLSAASGSSITVTPTAAGTFAVTVLANDGLPNGCANSAVISIVVKPNPVITGATATPATICAGGSSLLQAVSIGGSGLVTVGTQSSTGTTAGPYRSGASSDNKVQYLFTAAELASAGILPGKITSAAFNVTSVGTGAMNNFTINVGTTAESTITTDFDVSPLTTVYGPLTYTAVSGINTHTFTTPFTWDGVSNIIVQICHDAANSGSSTVAFSTAAGTTTFALTTGACALTTGGTTSNNRALITFGYTQDNTSNYTWTWNPGNIPAGTTGSTTVTPGVTTIYTATATALGCSTNSAPVTVTVQPVGANATATTAPICIGGSTTISANATGGGPFTYAWSDGTATVLPTTASITVSPTVTTTYTVTVTDNCGNFTTSSKEIVVNPLPTVSVNEASTTICLPATYPLTSTTNAASPTYQWILTPNDISGATGSGYIVTATGFYKVRVTDGVTGCSNTSAQVSVTINQQPVAIVITPASATVCSGASVTLTAASGAAGSGTVGTGTVSGTTTGPYKGFFGGHKAQYLFTPAELTGIGLVAGSSIQTIAMNITAFTSPYTFNNFTISMKNTSTAVLTGTPETGTTPVFGPTNYTLTGTAPFTVSHTLSNAFAWDGTSNLLVEFCFNNNNGGGVSANSANVRSSTTTTNMTSYFTADNNANVCTTTSGWTTSTTRPNLTFGHSNFSAITWAANPTLSTTTAATTIATPITPGANTYTAIATNSFGCTRQADAIITATACSPVWTGTTSTNWFTPTNWSSGVVPSVIENVTIATASTGFYPVLTTTDVTVGGTLTLGTGTSITIGGRTLTVNGGIVNNNGVLIGSNTSNLTLGATSTLRMAAGAGGTLKNLTINAGTTTLASALDITGGTGGNNNNSNGVVTVANGAVLASGGFLTFKSNISGTARLAAGSTAGGYVTGDVTVERYIPQTARAWRMLSVPTKGAQKIHQAWQEGSTSNNPNPKPGYGLSISSNVGPYATLVANGFDELTAKASMQKWNSATSAWVDITATQGAGSTGNIENAKGYSIYVRGDRTQFASGSITTTTATTLRTTGALYLGDQAPVAVGPNKFDMFGNNFVSPIDFTLLSKPGISNVFYVWDPKLPVFTGPTLTSYGGYVSFSGTNSWAPIPQRTQAPFGTYNSANQVIETGQAFFVVGGAAGGTLAVPESAKVTGSGVNVFRPTSVPQKLKANLYTVDANNNAIMADANVSVFDNAYANAVDGDDAPKLSNAGENLAIYRDNHNLVVEGRQAITEYDTTYFNMWNMVQGRQYRLELITEQMDVPGLSATLIDRYTGTSTPLNMTGATTYDFNINLSAAISFATDRFKVVYRQVQLAPLPVTFLSVSANKLGAAVKVDWKVAAERGIQRYEVERSADGSTFAKTGTVTATGNNSTDLGYSWMDATPLSGTNFYRIKSIGVGGEIKYTNIVKVSFGDVKPAFAIAPNPVEGSVVNLQFRNQAAGRYTIRLMSNAGQAVFTKVLEHAGGNSTQLISLPSAIARGAYQLEIISPDKTTETQNLFINTIK